MIDKAINAVEELSEGLGLSMKLVRPGRSFMRKSAVINGVFGVTLLFTGIAVSNKILVCLGTLGLAGSVINAVSTTVFDEER